MAVTEFAKFKLRTGVTDETFLAAETKIRAGQIRKQPGFLGRDVGKGDDGSWYAVIRWETMENAAAWTPIFMKDPDGQAFASLLDFASMRQERVEFVTL